MAIELTESHQKINFIVGLFVVVAVICVVFIALQAANIAQVSNSGGYTISAQFEQIGALNERAPVKSSGVRVGRVKDIHFNNELFIAEVILVIDGEHQFPVDSIFSIVSANLLGGQYVSIDPGGAEENLKEGDVVDGDSAIVLEHLISKFLFDEANKEE